MSKTFDTDVSTSVCSSLSKTLPVGVMADGSNSKRVKLHTFEFDGEDSFLT